MVRFLAICLGCLFAITMIAGDASAGSTPDSNQYAVTFQIDLAHDGNVTLVNSFSPPLKKIWTKASKGYIFSYPLIAEGKVFFTGTDPSGTFGVVYALDLKTGQTIWSKTLPNVDDPGYPQPGYDNGELFVTDGNAFLYAYTAKTGRQKWFTWLNENWSNAGPIATNGLVYATGYGEGGTLTALNETTGAVAWQANVANGDGSIPAYGNSGVFVTYPCNDTKFDPATGHVIWRTGSGDSVDGHTPVLFNNDLYVEDPNGNGCGNRILDAQSGNVVTGTYQAVQTPALFQGTNGDTVEVYTGTDYGLNCLDTKTNTLLWSFTPSQEVNASPIIINGTIFAGSVTGALFALDESGNELWSTNTSIGESRYLNEGQGTLIAVGYNGIAAFVPRH